MLPELEAAQALMKYLHYHAKLDLETTLPGGAKSINHGWVALMLSHIGEHVGHMALTRQLYKAQK